MHGTTVKKTIYLHYKDQTVRLLGEILLFIVRIIQNAYIKLVGKMQNSNNKSRVIHSVS